ncbi:MAG: hypothetical protein GDA48_26865 [Hormoscilla sp. GM102CHS1]|nr:hypothetical protein [Hormoscilla sp. GM102CHS1]
MMLKLIVALFFQNGIIAGVGRLRCAHRQGTVLERIEIAVGYRREQNRQLARRSLRAMVEFHSNFIFMS